MDVGISVLNVGILFINPQYINRYNNCIGREESIKYNLKDFYDETTSGPVSNIPFDSSLRLLLYFLFLSKNFWTHLKPHEIHMSAT